jgi:tetratricopeptide (TPR) repeat protein
MTVVLDKREQQIAAPRQLEFLPPRLMVRREPVVRLAKQPEGEPEWDDFHLFQARQLTERNRNSPAAWARLAQAELIAGDHDAAVGAALTSLEIMDPIDGGAALADAIVLVSCNRNEDAERALARLEAPGDAHALQPLRTFRATLAAQRGDFDHALKLMSGVETSEGWSLLGWIKLQQHDYANAIKFYRRALREGRADPEVLTNIGYAHAALGQRDRAIRDTQYALSLRPANQSRVGLNLSAYYSAEGAYDNALQVLRGLQEDAPRELDLWFAQADVYLSMGEPKKAERTLRRIRTGLWAHLSVSQQAELTANMAFLGWMLEKRSKKEAAAEILRELERVEYSTPRLAEMLPPLLDHFSDAKTLRKVLVSTLRANPGKKLRFLDVNLAVLERRFSDAIELSVAWVKDEPLNSTPAVAATYLLSDVAGDPEAASELGLQALRRMPAAKMLANNVAYSLTLAGRAEEARRWVPEDHSPQSAATAGLVAMRLGDQEQAVQCYRRAFSRAAKSNDPDLVALVALNAKMAVHCFGGDLTEDDLGVPAVEFSDSWDDQARFEIIHQKLDRMGIELPRSDY